MNKSKIYCDKLIDMHTHTNYSDGDLSPQELIRLAIKKRIGILAITDHDTIEGIKKVDKNDSLITDSGIKIINGIELSIKIPKGRMHILGYDIDLENETLNKKMKELQDNSINSVLSVMEQIKRDYQIIFSYEDIKEGKNDLIYDDEIYFAKLYSSIYFDNSAQEAVNDLLEKKLTYQKNDYYNYILSCANLE